MEGFWARAGRMGDQSGYQHFYAWPEPTRRDVPMSQVMYLPSLCGRFAVPDDDPPKKGSLPECRLCRFEVKRRSA